MFKKTIKFLSQGWVIITIVYWFTFILMLPLKNLAFFDDFAYIRTVERLYKTGELKISEWATVAMVFQSYWALFFAKTFGFSIKILHLSNIVLFYFGLIFFYQILRKLNFKEDKSVFFTLILLGFPWMFQFIYTFMSDTFYVSLSIIAIYFYIRGLQSNSYLCLLLAGLFTGFTFLTRQIGVSIQFAFIIVLIYIAFVQKKYLWKEFIASQLLFMVCVLYYFIRLIISEPTAAYSYHVIYNVQKTIIPYLLPIQLGQIRITNTLYIEAIIQRGLGYLSVLMVFLLPLFLSHKPNPKGVLSFINHNSKILIFSTFFTLFFFSVDYIFKSKFSSNYNAEILRYDTNFLDWKTLWQQIVWYSIPLWIGVFAIFISKLNKTFFLDQKSPSKSKFVKLLSLYSLFAVLFFLFLYRQIYPRIFVFNLFNIIDSFSLYIRNLFSEYTKFVFIESWFIISLILFSIILITYLYIYKKIKRTNTQQIIILFLLLTLGLELLFIQFFAYFYWSQYIIQILPLIIIFTAYLFKSSQLNKTISIILVIFILSFSVSITRYRYQIDGNKWELGTKLVNTGVSAYNVSEVNWAWKPYWFFESSFDQQIKKYNGDKLQAARNNLQPWFKGDATGQTYEIITVDVTNQHKDLRGKIIYESESFWLFDKQSIIQKKVILYKY